MRWVRGAPGDRSGLAPSSHAGWDSLGQEFGEVQRCAPGALTYLLAAGEPVRDQSGIGGCAVHRRQ